MKLNTFSLATMFVVALLALLNIFLYSTLEIGYISIMNNKKILKITDGEDKNIKNLYKSFIIILVLSLIIYIVGLLFTNEPIFMILILLLSLVILGLSIMNIINMSNFSKDSVYKNPYPENKGNVNMGNFLNFGNFITVKMHEEALMLIRLTTYLFFGMAIISSLLCVITSFRR
jgi:hypothetical protein